MTLREQMEAALIEADGGPLRAHRPTLDALLPVVEAAVAAERERCARIAEDFATCGCKNEHGPCMIDDGPLEIAAAIRAA